MHQSLGLCYERIRPLLTCKNLGFPPEPAWAVSAVDDHRRHWRPKQVKVLLLAESHVYTEDDFALNYRNFPELKSLPRKYVRLVYCLGYGERSLVEGKPSHNRGTPQFWKILSTCAGVSKNKVLKRSEPDDSLRIRNKSEVLNQLQQSGIWLQDASIVALYRNGLKPPKRVREAIISECWAHYIFPQIREEDPHDVIVIGEHVYQILKRQPHGEVITDWIRQPQGCRRKGLFDAELKKIRNVLTNNSKLALSSG